MGYNLYRGYVEVVGKEAASAYKSKTDADLDTLAMAQRYAGYAGVLASETVMLDADSAAQAGLLSKAIDTLQLTARRMATNRGMHATMRDTAGLIDHCCTGVELACGIVVDIKTGRKASYDVLKVRGRERMVLSDADETHDYSDIPECFRIFRKMTYLIIPPIYKRDYSSSSISYLSGNLSVKGSEMPELNCSSYQLIRPGSSSSE